MHMKAVVSRIRGLEKGNYQSQNVGYKPQRYYKNSSMEVQNENHSTRDGEEQFPMNDLNGKVQSLRSSAGFSPTHYSSQTPVSGSKREYSTNNYYQHNMSGTPFTNSDSKS